MKILHVVGTAHFGGIGRLVLDLTRAQLGDGLDVGILFYRAEGEMLEFFSQLGVPMHSANLRSGYDMSPMKLAKIMKIYRDYDLLHFHAFNPAFAMAAALGKKKVVFTEHGNFAFGRIESRADRIKKHLMRVYLNGFCHFVTFNSEFTMRVAVQRYGLEHTPKAVVYNGIHLEQQKDGAGTVLPEHRLLSGKFVVGTSSRFAGFKRIDRLIRAFAGFRKNKDDVVLLLVGDGEKRKELEELVAETSISGITVFTGYRPNVSAYQAAMDVFVVPSENEPFGLVALEAYSVGTPAVAFEDGGGVVEVISGYSRADVVKDHDAMIDRLNYYYQNRNSLSHDAPSRIDYVKKFDASVMSSAFSKIYKTVLPCAP